MTDTQSNILPSASVTLGLLLADVNGDGSVTKTDSSQVKLDQGKTTDATNFRADVNASSSFPYCTVSRERESSAPSPPTQHPNYSLELVQ